MATADKQDKDYYFYVKSQGLREKVLRGLVEDENPQGKQEIQMPFGAGRYVPNTDRTASWYKPITMSEIIASHDEKELLKNSMTNAEDSLLNVTRRKKKLLSAADRADALYHEAKDDHPKSKVFTKANKSHFHETIALPTIRLQKTLDDLCPSDEEDEEEELESTFLGEKGGKDAETSKQDEQRVTSDASADISQFSSKLQRQNAVNSVAEFARNEDHLELIMEHRISVKTEVPLPYKVLLYEETLPVIKSTIKAYREILKKDNELRIEAEEYLRKMEKRTRQFTKIKRQT